MYALETLADFFAVTVQVRQDDLDLMRRVLTGQRESAIPSSTDTLRARPPMRRFSISGDANHSEAFRCRGAVALKIPPEYDGEPTPAMPYLALLIKTFKHLQKTCRARIPRVPQASLLGLFHQAFSSSASSANKSFTAEANACGEA